MLDRAKGVLMDRDGLTEQAAFDFLQKTAMASRRAMRAVADDVLSGSSGPRAHPRWTDRPTGPSPATSRWARRCRGVLSAPCPPRC